MTRSKVLITRVENDKAHLEHDEVDIGEPAQDQILVCVQAVAQNPTDVQCLDTNAFGQGAVLGCDFVGTIVSENEGGKGQDEGEVIAGLIWGGEKPGLGVYSQYTFATDGIYFKVPSSISHTEAATIPLACTTAWLALFTSRCLSIERSHQDETPLLIWAGSSSVGLFAIQLARIYSIPTVAICSTKHFEHCKSLGASWTFEYKDKDIVKNVQAEVPGIKHVFDCIGNETSSTQASQTVDSGGGRLCTVRPGKAFTENVESRVAVSDVLVWTAFLKDHAYKEFKYPASEEDHGLTLELFQSIPGWLDTGKLQPNRVKVIPGGLSAVEEGFQMHRDGKISGFKLVYEL